MLYYSERYNPDQDMQDNYGSVPKSLWSEVINLHGEWPWPDYTTIGKCLGTFIALFSTGICMVPIVIFADGYQERLQETAEDSQEINHWQLDHLPSAPGIRLPGALGVRHDLFYMLYSHLLTDSSDHYGIGYRVFRAVSVTLTLGVTTTLIWCSSLEVAEMSEEDPTATTTSFSFSYGLDVLAICFFTVEFILRVMTLQGLYLVSWIGIVDLVSLLALGIMLTDFRESAMHPSYKSDFFFDDIIIPLRLMRLLMLENYVPSFFVLGKVIWLNRRPLLKSGFALAAVWYIFGTIIYVLEYKKDPSDDDEVAGRFPDILTGLPHALVHLTGDYPITAYDYPAQIVHVFALIFGMCVVGVFTGIFSAGYVNFLLQKRELERRMVAERRLNTLMMVVLMLQRRFRMRRRHSLVRRGEAPREIVAPQQQNPLLDFARSIVRRRTLFGEAFMALANTALVVNVFNTLLGSMSEVEDSGAFYWTVAVEYGTFAVFVAEYVLQVLAAPDVYSAVCAVPRVIDFICLMPTVLLFVFQAEPHKWKKEHKQFEHAVEAMLVCRVVRILDFRCIGREAATIKRTLKMALPGLLLPAVMALDIWVITAGLMQWLENFYGGPDKEHMGTMGDALYWCCIYLLGEWANDEFSDGAGSRLCILYCLWGVALFSIPVGILIEATTSTLKAMAEEQKELRRLRRVGTGGNE